MKPVIRKLMSSDAAALQQFFVSMPSEDRTFFFWDVEDPRVAASWADNDKRHGRVALDDEGQIAAFAALQPGVDWSSHVAELVLAVAPKHRRNGLGKSLARTMLIDALEHGFSKVTVMIAAGNAGATEMFRKLGFEGEALLRDQLRSPQDGSLQDVVLLAHLADENWSSMVTGGLEQALQ